MIFARVQQIDRQGIEGTGKLEERHDCRIAPATFKIRDVLLRKARALGELLLRQLPSDAQAAHIQSDELSHVHAQSIGGQRERELSTIICKRLWSAVLDFRTLLELAKIEPAKTLVVRHIPVERSLKRVLPWLVVERPDLFLAYQQIQWQKLEKAMTRATHLASFVGQDRTSATFAGVWKIGSWQVLDYDGYRTFPGNGRLESLGMSGRAPDMPDCLAFDLEPMEHYAEWIGRLTINWPMPYQQWYRWAANGHFPIESIDPESRFVRGMPDWTDLVLTSSELAALPSSWGAIWGQWRGVYYIHDTARNAGYVGSAYGQDNLLGRWRAYAHSGHGGNKELRNSVPTDLRFSILQRTSPDLDANDVIALEASWKVRLHTREAGLNCN